MEERRSVNDFSGAQTGDVSSRDVAGRDVHHHGPDLDALTRFVEGVHHTSDAMVAALERVARDVGTLRNETLLYQELEQDRWRHQERANAALRRWLAALTLALALFAAVVAALVWREMAALAARVAYDVAISARLPGPR